MTNSTNSTSFIELSVFIECYIYDVNIPIIIGTVLFFFITPLILRKVTERWKFLETIGLVTLCYIAGILAGNLIIPLGYENTISQVVMIVVPLSIPALLFVTDLSVFKKQGKRMLLSFFLMVCAVTIAILFTVYFLGDKLEESWKIGSMMMGVSTGGTPNMSAIGVALGVEPEVFAVLNGADIFLGGAWLLFILAFSARVYGLFLHQNKKKASAKGDHEILDEKLYGWRGLVPLAVSALILAIAIAISWLITRGLNEIVILLTISTLGILASTQKKIRELPGAFGVGNYLLLVFCVAVGSMANIKRMAAAAPEMVMFVAIVMFGSIFLHAFLAWLFKIDRDTVIMTSTAGIYGPPFIAPVAKAIGRPGLIPIGIAIALLGFAVGNYCGIGLSYILRLL